MPTHKVKIFNQSVELNYQEKDKEKLIGLIDSLKNRLEKYKNLSHRISNSKILILLAIELEDKISDLIMKKENDQLNSSKEFNKIKKEEKFSSELINLKDEVIQLNKEVNFNNTEKEKIIELIYEIDNEINKTKKLIIKSYND